ncbi:MAG: hypothetical protein F6K48_28660 [Okeania sp. SIO3H1]|nr:hypothetical protein [Okeania sp. SIO3H1]
MCNTIYQKLFYIFLSMGVGEWVGTLHARSVQEENPPLNPPRRGSKYKNN